MADVVEITIQASGAGWADYVLVLGSQTFSMDGVSYCSDALGDLLRAALQLAAGGREANCAFDREPYEWRLNLQVDVDPERLFLRVLEFPDFQKQSPTETGEVCFRGECGTRDFTLAVERAAVALLNEKGDAGYRDWWNMPFPSAALRALQAAHAGD